MSTVRVPANVDTADKILFGLTARQVAILAPVGVLVIVVWKSLEGVVPTLGVLIGCAPIAAISVGLALGRRDGASLDRLAIAALRQPRHVLAPGRIDSSASLRAVNKSSGQVQVGALRGPVRTITADGVLDLGTDGYAVGLDATTVNFALRSNDEQSTLTAGFARVLHSVPTGLHIVISSAAIDVTSHIARVRDAASRLRDPALAHAAHGFAAWMDELNESAVTRRVVTLVVTAPSVEMAIRAADTVCDGCTAIGVTCARLDAAALAARIRSGVDPFTTSPGDLP